MEGENAQEIRATEAENAEQSHEMEAEKAEEIRGVEAENDEELRELEGENVEDSRGMEAEKAAESHGMDIEKAAESRAEGSHEVDSPPKKQTSVIPIASESSEPLRVAPLSVVEPADSSCIPLSTNTELCDKATKQKVGKVYNRTRSQREKYPAPAKMSPYVNHVKGNPFISVNQEKLKLLNAWLGAGKGNVVPKGCATTATEFFEVLRGERRWLWDWHLDAYLNVMRLRLTTNPTVFPSERIAFLDTTFTINWREKHQYWVKNNELHPGGSLDYVLGEAPEFAQTGKRWAADVDVLYGVLFLGGNHWVAIIIYINDRKIEVLDSAIQNTNDDELKAAVEPFAQMVPHLLWYVASPYDKAFLSTEPYEILPRPTNLPVNKGRQGDCGVYALKFIECHALGMEIPKALNDRNMLKIWEQMAVDIFEHIFKYGESTSAIENHLSISDYCNSVEFLRQI